MPRERKTKTVKLAGAGCAGGDCDWAFTKSGLSCVEGFGGCDGAYLAEAAESYFHPKELVEATKKIDRILAKIPKDPEGRTLSLCHTRMGFLLAFCTHTGKPRPKNAVTRHDSDERVAKALGLIPKR